MMSKSQPSQVRVHRHVSDMSHHVSPESLELKATHSLGGVTPLRSAPLEGPSYFRWRVFSSSLSRQRSASKKMMDSPSTWQGGQVSNGVRRGVVKWEETKNARKNG